MKNPTIKQRLIDQIETSEWLISQGKEQVEIKLRALELYLMQGRLAEAEEIEADILRIAEATEDANNLLIDTITLLETLKRQHASDSHRQPNQETLKIKEAVQKALEKGPIKDKGRLITKTQLQLDDPDGDISEDRIRRVINYYNLFPDER